MKSHSSTLEHASSRPLSGAPTSYRVSNLLELDAVVPLRVRRMFVGGGFHVPSKATSPPRASRRTQSDIHIDARDHIRPSFERNPNPRRVRGHRTMPQPSASSSVLPYTDEPLHGSHSASDQYPHLSIYGVHAPGTYLVSIRSIFEKPFDPPIQEFVFVLDVSSTLSSENFELVKKWMLFTISTLRNEDKLSVLSFEESTRVIQPFQCVADCREVVLLAISNLKQDDGSVCNFDRAVLDAIGEMQTVGGEKGSVSNIICVTGGPRSSSTASSSSPDHLIEELDACFRSGRRFFSLHCCGIGPDIDIAYLRSAARRCGGRVYHTLNPVYEYPLSFIDCLCNCVDIVGRGASVMIQPIGDAFHVRRVWSPFPVHRSSSGDYSVSLSDIGVNEPCDVVFELEESPRLSKASKSPSKRTLSSSSGLPYSPEFSIRLVLRYYNVYSSTVDSRTWTGAHTLEEFSSSLSQRVFVLNHEQHFATVFLERLRICEMLGELTQTDSQKNLSSDALFLHAANRITEECDKLMSNDVVSSHSLIKSVCKDLKLIVSYLRPGCVQIFPSENEISSTPLLSDVRYLSYIGAILAERHTNGIIGWTHIDHRKFMLFSEFLNYLKADSSSSGSEYSISVLEEHLRIFLDVLNLDVVTNSSSVSSL